jgi:hypothetical protein
MVVCSRRFFEMNPLLHPVFVPAFAAAQRPGRLVPRCAQSDPPPAARMKLTNDRCIIRLRTMTAAERYSRDGGAVHGQASRRERVEEARWLRPPAVSRARRIIRARQ